MLARNDSDLFSELTFVELQSIIAEHFPTKLLLSSELLSGGLYNTIYLLTFSDGDKVILRVGPRNQNMLLPYEKNLMLAETEVSAYLMQNNIPTPKILVVDTKMNLINRTYMLISFIPGVPLIDEHISLLSRARCYEELGQYVRKIHSIHGPRFGRLAEIVTGGGYRTWGEAVLHEVSILIDYSISYSLFHMEEYKTIQAIFQQYAKVLDAITVPRLAHGDLWEGNVIVQENKGGYHLAAIIDADRAMFGDPDYDFPSGYMFNDSFVRGYGGEPDKDAEAGIRQKLYALLYSMTSCYVWICQHKRPSEAQSHYRSVYRLLDELS